MTDQKVHNSTQYSIVLDDRELCDLEMILVGGFAPLEGFLDRKNYLSVVENMRLSNGTVWPMPIQCATDKNNVPPIGAHVNLLKKDNTVVATLEVKDTWPVDVEYESKHVVGTTDVAHPYVHWMLTKRNKWYVGGKVTSHVPIEHYNFTDLRYTPKQSREWFEKLRQTRGVKNIVGFQSRNPLHFCHMKLITNALQNVADSHVFIHPVVGETQPGDVNPYHRVRCYRHALKHLPEGKVTLSVIPLAMRMAGPREALWHALIRKNYGCTHFIVGRDHAGPSSCHSVTGKKFYDPFAAHKLCLSVQDEIGITFLLSPEIVFSTTRNAYILKTEVKDNEELEFISGSEVRRRLREGLEIPEWFSPPEVVKELRTSTKDCGLCIYFVGLSGAGKSTIATALSCKLKEKMGVNVATILDGDIVRRELSRGLGFDRKDRSINVRRIGFVASEIVKHGGICICANIAPYRQDRRHNRQIISQYGKYIEVYVSTDLEECERRDVKGLYKKARSGEITQFTGISDPFEVPTEKEAISIDTVNKSVTDTVNELWDKIVLLL